jgi:hypothetical protein
MQQLIGFIKQLMPPLHKQASNVVKLTVAVAV